MGVNEMFFKIVATGILGALCIADLVSLYKESKKAYTHNGMLTKTTSITISGLVSVTAYAFLIWVVVN